MCAGIDRSDSVTGVSVGGPFYDIMYPAWTFWGGGPVPLPPPKCFYLASILNRARLKTGF